MTNLLEIYGSEEAVKEFLEDNAYEIYEDQDYDCPLTEDEILKKKDDLAKSMIELAQVKGRLDDIKAEFIAKIQPIEQTVDEAVMAIDTGKVIRTGDLFLMADHEASVMHIYNSKGRLIKERALDSNEKQLKIGA